MLPSSAGLLVRPNLRFFARSMIKAALIDLSGTLHIETQPTPNAVAALDRLRNAGVQVKLVTNTTKESSTTLLNRLKSIGFQLESTDIHSSLSATAVYVRDHKLNPFYLLSNDARTDFPSDDPTREYDSVVVGLAPELFSYEHLNKAFNILLLNKGSQLLAVHEGKYYKRSDGLALGPGCFVKGLEYATGAKAVCIGKPNGYFFESGIPNGVLSSECVMIGDDATDDIAGAQAIGIRGLQVKTGKYLPDVVPKDPPTALVENFDEAVNWILQNKQ